MDDAGIAVQPLSAFTFGHEPRLGLVLGYGAIGIDQIAEGLRRMRECFAAAA
jgi:GntR family transcriptional regulator/MocR family aminotransferase